MVHSTRQRPSRASSCPTLPSGDIAGTDMETGSLQAVGEPRRTGDTGEAAQGMSRILVNWQRTKASRTLDRISSGLHWLGRWLLRFVLRTIRAFLAGVGAFALLVLGLARSVGIEQVGAEALLGVLLTGGVIGVMLQRSFKRFALLRRAGELLTLRVAVLAATE